MGFAAVLRYARYSSSKAYATTVRTCLLFADLQRLMLIVHLIALVPVSMSREMATIGLDTAADVDIGAIGATASLPHYILSLIAH